MDTEFFLSDLKLKIFDSFTNHEFELIGFDNIYSFFQSERDYWNSSREKPHPIELFVEHFKAVISELENFKNRMVNENDDTIKNEWGNIESNVSRTNFKNKTIMFSKTPHARFIYEIANSNPGAASYFYKYVTNDGKNEINNFIGFLKGYEFKLEEGDREINKRSKSEIESLNAIRIDWEQKTQTIDHEFIKTRQSLKDWKVNFIDENEKHKDGLNEWKNKFIENCDQYQNDLKDKHTNLLNNAKEMIKEQEILYRNKLSLEAPVDYWKKRIRKYQGQGMAWIILLTLLIYELINILYGILYNLPNAFTYNLFKGDAQAIKGVIIFFSIISFGAYLAKTFTRLTFSSFHLQRDAEEREQLTLVFLALIKDGTITEKERDLVLQSLFSRAETGLLGSESSPTMPGIGSILEKFGSK